MYSIPNGISQYRLVDPTGTFSEQLLLSAERLLQDISSSQGKTPLSVIQEIKKQWESSFSLLDQLENHKEIFKQLNQI